MASLFVGYSRLPLVQKMKGRSGRRISLSIKTVVFGATGMLALLAIGKFGWEASQNWRIYSRALEQRGFDATADHFISGTYAILLERLDTDIALQAPDAADRAATAKIEASRKSVGDIYVPALAARTGAQPEQSPYRRDEVLR